jgi:hypothetical protein
VELGLDRRALPSTLICAEWAVNQLDRQRGIDEASPDTRADHRYVEYAGILANFDEQLFVNETMGLR